MATVSDGLVKLLIRLSAGVLIVVAILTITACNKEPQTPLRVGTNVWPGYEPLYLAREQGYISPESVKLVEYNSASEVIWAFRNRAIDVAALTLDEVLLMAETTPNLSVILVTDVSNGGDVILGQPSLSSLSELKQKTVGLEASALGAYVLTRALQTVDLKPEDVRLVSLEVHEQEQAFKAGRLDAVVTFEPVRTKLLAAGARQLFDSSQIPGEILDVLVVRRPTEHEAQIAKLVDGWFHALDFIRKKPDQAASLMAKREQLTAKDFQKALDGLRFPSREENRSMLEGSSGSLIGAAQQLGAVMVANKLLQRPPQTNGLFDDAFVRGARR